MFLLFSYFSSVHSKFKSIEDLALHKKQLHPVPMPFQCTYCSIAFARSKDLNHHISSVHGFKCDLCPSYFIFSEKTPWFSEMAQLTQHKEKCHSKMILCKYCVTRCASTDDLKKHVSSVHSFQCNLCPALFVDLALLTYHKEKNHPANFGCNMFIFVHKYGCFDSTQREMSSCHFWM